MVRSDDSFRFLSVDSELLLLLWFETLDVLLSLVVLDVLETVAVTFGTETPVLRVGECLLLLFSEGDDAANTRYFCKVL